MGEFVAVANGAYGIFFDFHIGRAMPLPNRVSGRVYFADKIAPNLAAMIASGQSPLNPAGSFVRQALPSDIDQIAVGQPAEVMVLVVIDIFPNHVAIPIQLHDPATARRHAFRASLASACRQEIAVRHKVGVIARRRRQIPFVDDITVHINQAGFRLGNRREKRKAFCCLALVVLDKSGT